MELTFENLQQAGAFAGQPVARSITWKQIDIDGNEQEFTADTFIKRNNCSTFEAQSKSARSGNELAATMIATQVCNADGSPVLDYEQALALNDNLSIALLNAIGEVNPRKAKNSPPTTSFGANLSLTESAEIPSSEPSTT